MKITHIDKSDMGHCQIKVKVTVGLQKTIQTVRSYNSTLVQNRKLKLSMYVHLIYIYIYTKFLNIVTLE